MRLAFGVKDGIIINIHYFKEMTNVDYDFLRKEKEDSRNVFIRRYWYFDSVGDIAKCYGFSESKVKSMLHHTRNRLRKYLEREGVWI